MAEHAESEQQRMRPWRMITGLAWLSLGLAGPIAHAQVDSAEPRVVIGRLPDAAESRPVDLTTPAVVATGQSLNALVLSAVQAMPTGGTYRTNAPALLGLRRSIQTLDSRLSIEPTQAVPSFCSGATYLVFASVIAQLNREGRLPLNQDTLATLPVQEHQADGNGIWGRWNANGPGTARLFHESGVGRNFTSFDEAIPGDFLKVFWNEEIGYRESGHSVIFLGISRRPEGEFVQFWSSNQPLGFGKKEVPRQRIKRQLFSRFEHPENVSRFAALPARDTYLAAMLKRASPPDEMLRMVGALPGTPKTATPPPAEATPVDKNWVKRLFKR